MELFKHPSLKIREQYRSWVFKYQQQRIDELEKIRNKET